MKPIRKFAYAAALTLSALTFAPSLATAQEARGTFKLTHDVRWQNQSVAAGAYAFSLESRGGSELLLLRNLGGSRSGVIVLVSDTESATPADTSRILVVSRPEGRFVSAMELPGVGITLHFAVPPGTREMAKADSTAAFASAR